jgi:hypothetical protein
MNLDEWLKQTLAASDPASLGVQFLLGLANTLFLIYLVVFTTRRFTFVRSHVWVLIETFVAFALCFGVFRLFVALDLRHWAWFIPLCLFASVVEFVVWLVDGKPVMKDGRIVQGGRSMIDVNAAGKGLFQTDYRLVRRAAMASLVLIYAYWRLTPPA